MPTIHDNIAKRAIFTQEFANVVETKSLFADVATKLIATAKNISSPFTSVTVAKAHTQPCRVPLGTLTVDKDELVLDRYIGNAIRDCKEEMSFANFDLTTMVRGDLYKSVLKKLNTQAVVDFVADATVVGGTEDLSTDAKVRAFLIRVAANAEASSVGLANKIDGAQVVRAAKHGQPFVAAGMDAYVQIVSSVTAIANQSSLRGIEGRYIETPYGVVVINLGAAADNAKRLIYGTAGAPVMAFRGDMIETDMGEYVAPVTYDDGESGAGDDDLDISHGDAMLEKTWYISAQTKGKNGIFSQVQSLVSTRLMA